MAAKQQPQKQQKKAKPKQRNKIVDFIIETRKELLERSVWPSRDEVMTQTVVVIISLMLIAFALWAVDLAIGNLVKTILQTKTDIASVFFNKFTLIIGGAILFILIIYFAIRYLQKNRLAKR